jgi:hypothetical protein
MPVRSTAFEKFSFLKQILGLTDGSSFAIANRICYFWLCLFTFLGLEQKAMCFSTAGGG